MSSHAALLILSSSLGLPEVTKGDLGRARDRKAARGEEEEMVTVDGNPGEGWQP